MPVGAFGAGVEVAEVLVQQSSGRQRAQPGVAVTVAWQPEGPWGLMVEGIGSVADRSSVAVDMTQWLARPALLATLSLGGERTRMEVAAGPALGVTVARWDTTSVTVLDPCGRLRLGLAGTTGKGFWIVGGVGGAWGAYGGDYDVRAGVRWAP